MRRKDREITDINAIYGIISKCQTATLAMCNENEPYIVTVNFGFVRGTDGDELCFHCAKEGKKLSFIEKNPHVAFTMVSHYAPKEGSEACKWSAFYESVVGSGTARLAQPDEKKKYFDAVFAQVKSDYSPVYNEAALNNTCIVVIKIDELSAKANR